LVFETDHGSGLERLEDLALDVGVDVGAGVGHAARVDDQELDRHRELPRLRASFFFFFSFSFTTGVTARATTHV
jgi:hypothetical protein